MPAVAITAAGSRRSRRWISTPSSSICAVRMLAFLAQMAFGVFGIQPEEHLEATGGAGLDNPIGTGPYSLKEWVRGDSVVFERFDDYYGEKPAHSTAVLKWATESAGRLLELQSGTVDGITFPGTEDLETIENDPNLTLLTKPEPNIFYIGFTNVFTPCDNVDVRKAIALGIDRQRIVDTFYAPGSEVASHFTPCSVEGGCEGESWYDFDPDAAKTLLADAGFPDGFSTSIYYRDVTRGYLPTPGDVAADIQAQLKTNLNIDAEIVQMESGEFIQACSTAGTCDGIHLLGWTGDYPHVTNFLDFHFAAGNAQFGDPHPEIYEASGGGIGVDRLRQRQLRSTKRPTTPSRNWCQWCRSPTPGRSSPPDRTCKVPTRRRGVMCS